MRVTAFGGIQACISCHSGLGVYAMVFAVYNASLILIVGCSFGEH